MDASGSRILKMMPKKEKFNSKLTILGVWSSLVGNLNEVEETWSDIGVRGQCIHSFMELLLGDISTTTKPECKIANSELNL